MTVNIAVVARLFAQFLEFKTGAPTTLMALTLVILLPISYFVFHEKDGWQAVFGTVLAISRVASLFLA